MSRSFSKSLKKIADLQWVSYIDIGDHLIDGLTTTVLNFAALKRLITLSMRRSKNVDLAAVPHELSYLECLWLDDIVYRGPPLFEAIPIVPRLQELHLPRRCETKTFRSSQFPMLRQFKPERLSVGSVIDFSDFKNPGLSMCLHNLEGEFIPPPPDVPLGHFSTHAFDFINPSIGEMLPRIQHLNFEGYDQDHLCLLSRTMGGPPVTPEAPFGSATLVKFRLRLVIALPFGFGLFPCLLHLTLVNVKTQFTAASAPHLQTLMIEKVDGWNAVPLPSGHFSALLSLTLKNVDVEDGLTFTAPGLKELTFICVENANKVVVGRAKYPVLQVLNIMQPRSYYVRASDPAVSPKPHHAVTKCLVIGRLSFPQLEATAGLPPLIVNVDCVTPEREVAQLKQQWGQMP